MRRFSLVSVVAVLAACSPPPSDAPQSSGVGSASEPAATAASELVPARAGRAFRFSSLEDCALVREEHDEMPYREVLCAGPAGWKLRIADADARQTLSVIAPGGQETKLDVSGSTGGAFNAFGKTAEWRGPAAEPFAPDSLIVRLDVADKPHPAPETSYLLAVGLAPTPCLLARVAPGPIQNDRARTAADARGRCAA